jgi:tetratricopeptide (TPR) repeat protein
MRSFKSLLFVFAIFSLAARAVAQEEHQHSAVEPEKVGTVHFPISCKTEAQQPFERAVALLHSFWFQEANKGFTSVTTMDPDCAMGYWGMALSLWYPLWENPSEATLKQGWTAVQKAKTVGAKTDHERDYLAAVEAFYQDADKRDHRTRALAYEKAMEHVHLRYPEDREAAIFYALALNATALPTDKTYANQKKAGAILEKIFAEQPDHPGVAHYLIHSYDNPLLASRALLAARSYAKIAPSVPHALHMPSHIFTQLGLWQESIASNRASAAAAQEHGLWRDRLHAMQYLEYAYLQSGQEVEAKRVLDELKAIENVAPENRGTVHAFAMIPALYALERRQWSEAAALQPRSSGVPQAEAITYFARALGAARSGNTAQARADVEKLQSLHAATVQAKSDSRPDSIEIQRQAAAAWRAFAEGKREEALRLMRSAADLEDSSGAIAATATPLLPAHELLGDLLLELNEPAQALQEFETALRISPHRFNGLSGAARAAQLVGDLEKARTYYAQLVSLCDQADSARTELTEARTFLAKKE